MALDAGLLDTPYRLVRLIGEGGMGRVYEATHARLAGRYAVKVLLNRLSHDPDAVALFEREAKVTSSLQHPNIVQVIDFNATADGTEYLVMEHLCGESLAQRLRREKALSLESTAGIVEQVAAGLMAAHTHGVVHRDLKPDNVFLVPVEGSPRAWAKILDFGIALIRRPGASLKAERVLVGTPLYMSPEQLSQPAAAVDAATDQFALGVMTYEMLTGRLPFGGTTIEAIVTQVLTAAPPPMGINEEVEAVVRRALAKTPGDRYPSVIAFARALQAAVAKATQGQFDRTSAVMGELSLPETDLKVPRRRTRAVLPIAAAAVFASVAVSFLWSEPLTRGAARWLPAIQAPATKHESRPVTAPARVATVVPVIAPAVPPPIATNDERAMPQPSMERPIVESPAAETVAPAPSTVRRQASSRAGVVRSAARLRQRHASGRADDDAFSLSPSPFEPAPSRRGSSRLDPIMVDADAPMPPSDL